jgi:hypothetical protein
MRHTYLRQLRCTTGSVRRFTGGLFLVFYLLSWVLPTLRISAETRLPARPHELLATDPAALVRLLETARPTPLSTEAKTAILRSLPAQGELTSLDARALHKLGAMREILRRWRDTSLEVRIIDVNQAAVGLHARTVLLISKPALDLLRAEELQALVAHELGHEYVWVEYERASKLRDTGRAKELELLCDAIGIVILHQLGIDTSSLIAGVEKVAWFNREKFGAAPNENAYPTLAQRREFARAVRAWVAAGPNAQRSQIRPDGGAFKVANGAREHLLGPVVLRRTVLGLPVVNPGPNAYDEAITRGSRLLPRQPNKITVVERDEECRTRSSKPQ